MAAVSHGVEPFGARTRRLPVTTHLPIMGKEAMKQHWPRRMGVSLLLFAGAGCASFWEELVSHERDWAYITGRGKPHPLVVIRDSSDGARKAQALGELPEPLRHGGTAEDQ